MNILVVFVSLVFTICIVVVTVQLHKAVMEKRVCDQYRVTSNGKTSTSWACETGWSALVKSSCVVEYDLDSEKTTRIC